MLHIDPKTYTYWYKRPYISTGPVVSDVQSEGVKRMLGTVPIEADGSVAFRAPPGMALHFQLLDEHHRALQTMRSFVGRDAGRAARLPRLPRVAQPHARAARPSRSPWPGRRATITPPPWGDDTVSYAALRAAGARPVLRQVPPGRRRGPQDARPDRRGPASSIFTEPYLTLIGRPTWGAALRSAGEPAARLRHRRHAHGRGLRHGRSRRPTARPPPMTALSYKSRLIELASSGKHHDVKVDPISLQRLIAWVDAMCPYLGDEEVRQIPDPVFQGVDWLAIRPQIKTAPRIVRPGPVD